MPSHDELCALVNEVARLRRVDLICTPVKHFTSFRVGGDPANRRRLLVWQNNAAGRGRVGLNRGPEAQAPWLFPTPTWNLAYEDAVRDVEGVNGCRVSYTPRSFGSQAIRNTWCEIVCQVLTQVYIRPGMPGVIP
jgi:hypothetical protein